MEVAEDKPERSHDMKRCKDRDATESGDGIPVQVPARVRHIDPLFGVREVPDEFC